MKNRKAWEGRTPFWRLYCAKADLLQLQTALEYYMTQKELWNDQRWISLRDKVIMTSSKIETPLLERNPSYAPLFEDYKDLLR